MLLLMAACFLMAGCQKEGQGMQLIAEGFNGSKAAVEGLNSFWVNGETVNINGVEKTVVVDGSTAYITDVAAADHYRALYPDTLNSTAALNGDDVTVLIPRTYTYRESNGRQFLGVPMAAYGTSDSRLLFKHLTAALTVEIKNIYGFTIEVDSVVVSSNSYQLSGNKGITLAESITVNPDSSEVAAADKRVKVCFNGGTSLRILSGQTRSVQVPVLPVGDDNRFTIAIGIHKVDAPEVNLVFCRTQGNSQASYALARRQMGFAGVTLGGAFSSTSTKKVIISQGNLTYVPNTGEWAFHSHQYDICEIGLIDSTTRYIASGSLPIDLFGFGTSGYNNMYPYMTSKTSTDYVAPASSLAKTNYDWGWHNAISNGGNAAGQWYTLPYQEWQYIFNTRSTITSGINGNATTRYTYATLGGERKGIIIFPDEYTHPATATVSGAVFNNCSDFTATVTYDDWAKMEAAGAVFLPAAGFRNTKNGQSVGCHQILEPVSGKYWSASSNSKSKAYRFLFYRDGALDYGTDERHFGMSVRVVKDL